MASADHGAASRSRRQHVVGALLSFLSHHLLRLSMAPVWYWGEGAVAPTCVGVASRPDRCIVWSGQLFVDQVQSVLETQNPADAVAKADRLLADWPRTDMTGPARDGSPVRGD